MHRMLDMRPGLSDGRHDTDRVLIGMKEKGIDMKNGTTNVLIVGVGGQGSSSRVRY